MCIKTKAAPAAMDAQWEPSRRAAEYHQRVMRARWRRRAWIQRILTASALLFGWACALAVWACVLAALAG